MPDRITAFTADVEWRATTNKAEVDVERLRREFHNATQDMSTQALRAASAQERLDRALVRHGPSSRQARDAEVQLRRELAAGERAAERHTAALRRDELQIERLGRGALLGSGHLRGLARSIAFASTSFIGGYGLTYALRSALDEFRDAESVLARVQNAVHRSGLQWGDYSAQINRTIQAQSRLKAFDDEKLLDTFGRLVTRTKDVSEALKLNALAADIARGRNIDLEAATQIVVKASIGQIGQLRRLGIDIDKNATATQALAALQERYAGAAERFANSSAGAEERRKKAFGDLLEIIGRGIAPAVDDLNRGFADWIENTENQRRIQRDVNEAVRIGGRVAHGLAEGLDDIRAVAEPVVDALGGVESTAKLMLEAFAVYKLAKIVTGIRGIGLAWGFVKTQADLAAASEARAAGAGAGGGIIAGAAGRPGRYGPGNIATYVLPGLLATLATYGATVADQAGTSRHIGGPLDVSVGPGDLVSYRDPVTGKYVLTHGFRSGNLADFIQKDIVSRHPEVYRRTAPGADAGGGSVGAPTATAAGARGGRRGGGAGGGLSLPGQLSRAELALAKAREADDVQAERAALVEETRIIRAEIASKKAKFRDKTALYNQLAQVEDAIDAIDDARRAKEEARAKAREDKAKRARERRKEHARREARELVEEMRYVKDIDRERSLLIQQNIASYGGQVLAKRAGIAGTGNLFSEARDEFNIYGSNIAGRNGVLSGQDARALQALLTLVELAREGNQHTKATAKAVHVTAKSTPQEITIARALAHQGL